MNRWDEVLNVKKLQELLGKKEEEEKKSSPVCLILGVVLVVAVVAAIAYAAYRYFTPDYLEDFEDDFEDDFDDDFFDDEEERALPIRRKSRLTRVDLRRSLRSKRISAQFLFAGSA